MDQNEKSVPTHETQKQETAEPKTLASVLARMRAGVIPPHRRDEELLAYLADQIEAASWHDLAVVAARSALHAVRLTNEKWEREKSVAQNATVSGNVAVLRHALEICMGMMCRYCQESAGPSVPCIDMCETLRIAMVALDAPARNCDREKDDAEAEFAKEFGRAWNIPEDELATWLFAKAGKKGGVQ